MSKIIKAAELKVLISDDSEAVIRPVLESAASSEEAAFDGSPREGTILEAKELIAQAQAKAEEILSTAEAEVEQLWERTKAELEELRAQAQSEGYQAGYDAGYEEGQKQADAETARLMQVLQHTVETALQDRTSALAQLEQDFLKLSVILAEKIVKKSISEDPAWLKPVIEEAYMRLGAANECTIRLNPDDYNVIKEEELRLNRTGTERINFQPDPAVSPGGCIIEADTGTIDAGLEKRLGKMARHLMDVLYHEQ